MADPKDPKQELSFFDQVAGDLTPMNAEEQAVVDAFKKEGMKEEMKGLPITAPRVDILHQGAQMFKFTDAPEDDNTRKSFYGVVIHVDPQRAYWKQGIGEGEGSGNQPPDCFSRDLIKPDSQSSAIQSPDCATCQHNQFGSADRGRGKACKEVRRLFFLPDGKLDAHVMNVPPSSLKSLKSYFTFLLENKIQRPQMAITKFGLKSAENKEGTEYSELVLTFSKKVDERLLLLVLQMKKSIEEMVHRAAPMTKEDFAGKQIDAPPQT